jgi:hypothetical protein
MIIRRNKDGQQNLRDLKAAIKDCPKTADVYKNGRNWQISNKSGVVESCPWHYNERQAIQHAIYGVVEHKEEARYYPAN